MSSLSILEDLYRYNRWANERVFSLCHGLRDEQLDERREMGFGSLRNTLFHILAAEEIWWERWTEQPWRPFPMDAQGLPLPEIARRLERVAAERERLLVQEREHDWQRTCHYKDSRGNSYSNPLKPLLLHVANHGIHHRAQALNFLKHYGRTVPGGIDYLFFRLARPQVKQTAEAVAALRQFGLEVEAGESPPLAWDATLIRDYFAYGDWANARLLPLLAALDDAALDRSWEMGLGTLRRTALHLLDAERWWLRSWTEGPAAFEMLPATTTITQLANGWEELVPRRNAFLQNLDDEGAQRLVSVSFGGPPLRIPVIESTMQLGGHGTHHRAQLLNMLRHSGVAPPGLDFVAWVRDRSARQN